MIRIDKLLTPRGLLASAKMYSLILKDKNLYLINTGPGVQVDMYVRDPAELLGKNFVVNRGLKKTEDGERAIDSGDFDHLVTQKGNHKIALGEITEVYWDENGRFSKLVLYTAKGKFKFALTSFTNFEFAKELVACLKNR